MDLETIKRINRDALRTAQEASGSENRGKTLLNNDVVVYALAGVVAVAVYFLLQYYSPAVVTVTVNGEKKFDQVRAIIIAVIAGLAVVLLQSLLKK